MSESKKIPPGSIAWVDLTVDNADGLKDFYSEVVGWNHAGVSMGNYEDYTMSSPGLEQPVSGICHAKGVNAGLPARWLIYIVVADLDDSIEKCKKLGGKVVSGPTGENGKDRYCIIEDPSGANCAIFQQGGTS